MKSKKNNRQIMADNTRKKIYETAKELFTLHGIEKVSVNRIVENAGVAKGTFYIYFNSKDALIAALIAEHIQLLDIDYQAYIESFPVDTRATDLLFELVLKIVNCLTVTIGYDIVKLVYEVQLTKTFDTGSIYDYNRGVYKTFSLVVNKGIERGEFRSDLDADTITRHCILSLRGLAYEWCIRYPEFDFKSQSMQHFQIMLDGFKV